VAQKPSPADAAGGARQSEFVMIAQFGAQPGGGIAEALTYVTPPGGSAAADVGRLELLLAPFGAPSEFARTGACQFGLQHAFPAPTGLVRKADPGEMEDLMDQDALELAALGEDLGIEQNAAARNIRCGQMRAEGAIDAGHVSPAAVAEIFRNLVLLLAPFAPFFAAEMWEQMGGRGVVFRAAWPEADAELAKEDEVEIPVQVNGKLVNVVKVAAGSDDETVKAAALADEKVKARIEGKTVVKVIVVPNKLVNLVVK